MPKDDSAIYKRESIEELLTTHADAVSALRDAVADVLPTEVGLSSACQRLRPHLISFSYATSSPLILLFLRHLCQPVDGVEFDNLFLLRYILSFKTVAAAIEPCRTTLGWRIEQADVLHRLTLEGRAGIPNHSTFMKFQTVGDISTKFGGWPTYVVRTAHSDLPSLMNSLSVAEVRNFSAAHVRSCGVLTRVLTHPFPSPLSPLQQVSDCLHYAKELQWRTCDRLTRETGVLTKLINVIDMNNFSLFGADRRFFAALGDSSKRSAMMYPQLLGATACVNPPSFLRLLMSTFGSLMPQSAKDKQRFCQSSNTETESASKCPFLSMFGGTTEDGGTCPVPGLPDFLGGAEPTPPWLQPLTDRADRMTKKTIGARSSETVEIEISKENTLGMTFPCTVKWCVLVASYGLSVRAQMLDGKVTGDAAAVRQMAERLGRDVLPARKIKATEGLVEGSFEVARPGKLVITLDNSYSFLRSKSVQFRFEVDTAAVEAAMEARGELVESPFAKEEAEAGGDVAGAATKTG